MTVHKSQCLTIREDYSIYGYEDMRRKMLYVAMTRATKKSHINFCKIDNYKHHTGHIYSYEHTGMYQIKLHGFDSFKYKVVETIKYSNIRELWELEDTYINKYNSIDNGYNSRLNKIYI